MTEVNSVVCNRLKSDDVFRYGVRFEYTVSDEKEPSASELKISRELLKIERQVAGMAH